MIDLKELNKRVDDKLISVQKHPDADLFIYNYTPKTQYSRAWDEYTIMARGLILNGKGNVVARPFKKFFNLEEQKALPDEPFTVHEKLDGSLGILYWIGSEAFIATRGSFTSDQAIEGTKILNEKYSKIVPGLDSDITYLFEIIYPRNRIIVDYKDTRDLIMLARIETKTGIEPPRSLQDKQACQMFKWAKSYSGIKDLSKLKELEKDNSEGFVIHYKSGLRVKVKFDEYVRLHRLLTQVSTKTVWEMLRDNSPMEDLIDRVPDEFYQWLKTTISILRNNFDNLYKETWEAFKKVPQDVSRKDQAEYIKKQKNPHLLFSLLTDKPVEPAIWKMVRPEYEKPFRQDIDS